MKFYQYLGHVIILNKHLRPRRTHGPNFCKFPIIRTSTNNKLDSPNFFEILGPAPRFWTSNPDYDAQPELNKELSDAGAFAEWHKKRCEKDREVTQRRTNNHKLYVKLYYWCVLYFLCV